MERESLFPFRPRRLMVTGSRGWSDRAALDHALSKANPYVLVHGGARGADTLAAEWAERNGVTVDAYPLTASDWRRFGRSAGIQRNITMLDSGPDAVIAFWDGESPGTAHAIKAAKTRGLPVITLRPNGDAEYFDGAHGYSVVGA